MTKEYRTVCRRIREKTATIGVVGLGYVGLPLALLIEARGFKVIGIDIDPGKVEDLNDGCSYLTSIPQIFRQVGRISV